MTPTELRAALAALGWSQGRLAAECGVNPRTARKWALGEAPVPADVAALVRAAQAGGPDAWVFGDGDATGGEYAVHLRRPRLVARLVNEDDPDDAATADTLAGLVLALGEGLVLCEIRWIDPPPGEAGLQALIASCAAAIRRTAHRDRED
ncbi:MAG: helix-turn-helix domain-containing protein [Burkholderiaceae bacterium]|nr:helix-turn-helix domain-containing protein [Burkholderiaceae bacterium]